MIYVTKTSKAIPLGRCLRDLNSRLGNLGPVFIRSDPIPEPPDELHPPLEQC